MTEPKLMSPEAQKLWDEYGRAYDEHVATSADDTETREAKNAAAGRYIDASRAMYQYVVALEEKVAA